MNTDDRSRRSFLVDLLSSAAGIWATVTGLGLLLPRRAEADPWSDDCDCEPDRLDKKKKVKTKYGGRPPKKPKYGGRRPRKYGGPRPPEPPTKYGGPPPPKPGPAKYGGPPSTRKYGGRRPKPRPVPPTPKAPKYGGPPPPPDRD